MWSLGVDRKQLLELLGRLGSGEPPTIEATKIEKGGSVSARYVEAVLVWCADPAKVAALPTAFVLPPQGVQDILGWAATFLSEYVPFSSYFRLVEESYATEAFRLSEHRPFLGRVAGGAVGLILGELASRDERRWSVSGPTISSCSATASYALGRSAALGYNPGRFADVLERWLGVRSLGQTRGTSSLLDSIMLAWRPLMSLAGHASFAAQTPLLFPQGDVVQRLVQEVALNKKANRETWNEAVRNDAALMRLSEVLEAPREQRFRWLEQNRRQLLSISSDPRHGPAIVGYAVAASAPTGMAHLDYVMDLRNEAPEVPLWYGLFSGLVDQLGTLRSYGGIGHRLVRELERHEDILDRPSADIAISELFTLMRAERASANIAHTLPGRLQVELIPGVYTTLRWPPGTEGIPEPAPVAAASDDVQRQVNEALVRARDLTDYLQRVAEGMSPKAKSSTKWFGGGATKKSKKR